MAEVNIRVINITLNPFELRNEDSNFEIRCGENVRLVFSLPEGATDLQLTESGTLQVEAMNALNGFTAFAKEGTYTVGALSELNAQIEFSSGETAYGATQAGAYNLVVALKDASGNVVLSGVVPFNLYDVGYDGIVEPPESFRDEVLEAVDNAQAAATSAYECATSATESATSAKADAESAKQSSESANSSSQAAINSAENAGISAASASNSATSAQQSANAAQIAAEQAQQISDPNNIIGSLQVSKADTGILYFASSSYGTNSTFSAGEVFSVAYRTDFQFASDSAASNQYNAWSVGNPTNNNIGIQGMGDDSLRITYNGKWFCSYLGSNIRSAIKPINDIVLIVTNPTGGNINTSLYVNGVQIPQASYSAKPSLEITGYRVNALNSAPSTIDTTMKDFAIFNFDMSAAGAPYSVADYSAGKPVPPSLKRNGGIFSSDPNMGASTSGGWAINTPGGSSIVTKGAWRCFRAVYYCYNRTGDLPAGVEYAIDLSTKVSSAATGDAFLCNIGQGNFARFNGSRFKGRVSFWYRKNNTDTSASSRLSVQIARLIIAYVSGADVSDSDWHFFSEEIDITLTNIATGGFLGISSYATSGTFTDYPWSIADFKLEAYTQEVCLENYTFTVGSTQYIPDVSGNNYDITVASAGTVAGNFDTAIAKLASLITSTNA